MRALFAVAGSPLSALEANFVPADGMGLLLHPVNIAHSIRTASGQIIFFTLGLLDTDSFSVRIYDHTLALLCSPNLNRYTPNEKRDPPAGGLRVRNFSY